MYKFVVMFIYDLFIKEIDFFLVYVKFIIFMLLIFRRYLKLVKEMYFLYYVKIIDLLIL